MRKGKDPDPDLWLRDPYPDPGGPKTCRSCGSGSPTLLISMKIPWRIGSRDNNKKVSENFLQSSYEISRPSFAMTSHEYISHPRQSERGWVSGDFPLPSTRFLVAMPIFRSIVLAKDSVCSIEPSVWRERGEGLTDGEDFSTPGGHGGDCVANWPKFRLNNSEGWFNKKVRGRRQTA
jgi:hypothetical protein